MEFFVWNKQDSVMGLTANMLLNSRLDFLQDDVIVIHKKGEKYNVVMMETVNSLREMYDIDNKDPNVVGFIVSVILEEEEAQTVRETLKDIDEQHINDEDFSSYAELLDELISEELYKEMEKCYQEETYRPYSYSDPDCNVIDLSDIENAAEKKLTVVLHHAFVGEESDITQLKCMSDYKQNLTELEEKREKYLNESDFKSVEMVNKQIDDMESDILDSCDARIKIDVNCIYQYNESTIIDCVNGQTIIIDNSVVESLKSSAIEYEKRDGKLDTRYRVHYKTVDIHLSTDFNEIKERGNTLFVVSV